MNCNRAMDQADEECIAGLIENFDPMRRDMESKGVPRDRIKKVIASHLAEALLVANADLPVEQAAGVIAVQMKNVAAQVLARMFPNGQEDHR